MAIILVGRCSMLTGWVMKTFDWDFSVVSRMRQCCVCRRAFLPIQWVLCLISPDTLGSLMSSNMFRVFILQQFLQFMLRLNFCQDYFLVTCSVFRVQSMSSVFLVHQVWVTRNVSILTFHSSQVLFRQARFLNSSEYYYMELIMLVCFKCCDKSLLLLTFPALRFKIHPVFRLVRMSKLFTNWEIWNLIVINLFFHSLKVTLEWSLVSDFHHFWVVSISFSHSYQLVLVMWFNVLCLLFCKH